MNYELSRKALRQIEDIIRYTDAHFGEDQTAEYLTGLYHSFDILCDNPGMGAGTTHAVAATSTAFSGPGS